MSLKIGNFKKYTYPLNDLDKWMTNFMNVTTKIEIIKKISGSLLSNCGS